MIIKDSGRHITFYKTLTESPFQRNKPRNDRDIWITQLHKIVYLNIFDIGMLSFLQIIEPKAMNIPINQEKLRRFQSELEATLDLLEVMFLKEQNYLCGEDIFSLFAQYFYLF